MNSPNCRSRSNLKNNTPVDEYVSDESGSEDFDYSERNSSHYEVDVSADSESAEELETSPIHHTKVRDQTVTKDNILNENLVHNLIQNKSTANNNSFIVPILMGLLAVIVLFAYTSNSNPTVNKISIEDEVRNIKRQFPSQDRDTWPKLVSGIQSVINDLPTRPSVFLFLNLDRTDTVSHNIATEVAKIAARHLSSNVPLILTPEILNKHKKGAIIENYKEELEQHKVMLVTNVHKVKAEVAQSFHYFCDRENPMVKRSILIFTLNVGSNFSEDPIALAEDTLHAIWSPPLTDNLILPLITRLTTYVLPITAEKESIS